MCLAKDAPRFLYFLYSLLMLFLFTQELSLFIDNIYIFVWKCFICSLLLQFICVPHALWSQFLLYLLMLCLLCRLLLWLFSENIIFCQVYSSCSNFCLFMLCLLFNFQFLSSDALFVKNFFFFLVLCLLFVWRMLCLFPISYICLLKLCSLLNCQFFPFFLLKLCFSELSVSAFLVQANFLLLFANTLHVTHFSHFVSQCFCCEFF